MALFVTPGYDFQVNEIPTHQKFRLAALGISISGVPLSSLDSSIIGILNGATSGITGASMPSQGYMWVDPAGNTWVNGQSGPLQISRGRGGWETMRWEMVALDVGQIYSRGAGCNVQEASPGGSETRLQLRPELSSQVDGAAGFIMGVCPDTALTAVRRVVMRGGVEARYPSVNAFATWQPALGWNHPTRWLHAATNDGSAEWDHGGLYGAFPLAAGRSWFAGLWLGPDSGSSVYTDGGGVGRVNAYAYAYFFGCNIPRRTL